MILPKVRPATEGLSLLNNNKPLIISVMKRLTLLFAVSILVMPLFPQFQARMLFNSMGMERSFNIFSANAGYRYEFNENGQEGVVIVKKGSEEVIILLPGQKMAMRGPADNPMSIGNDPVGSYEFLKKTGSLKELGKETINGVECLKSELWNKNENEYGKAGQKMYTVWISEKYNFPVKMINHIDGSGNTVMEIKDIKPWTPRAESFEIPEGYNVMEMPKMNP